MNWINCTNALPEKEGAYLIILPRHNGEPGLVDVCHYGTHDGVLGWFFYMDGQWWELDDVIAWMPIPEPYYENKKEYHNGIST